MPEERNRVLVDHMSRWLFVTEPSGIENLEREGICSGVHLVGNAMIDSLLKVRDRLADCDIRARLGLEEKYCVLTLHRPGNVEDACRFRSILDALAPIAELAPIAFPVHPRTRRALEGVAIPKGLHLMDPLGYIDFIALVADAALVLTDSGGIQEETTVLGVPCLTMRPNTERPITIEHGTNQLVDTDPGRLLALGREALEGRSRGGSIPELWDGRAAERIVKILLDEIEG
jgi:UDP-N-acetylglucosamine 2-epimerase (non-hydrolysing)